MEEADKVSWVLHKAQSLLVGSVPEAQSVQPEYSTAFFANPLFCAEDDRANREWVRGGHYYDAVAEWLREEEVEAEVFPPTVSFGLSPKAKGSPRAKSVGKGRPFPAYATEVGRSSGQSGLGICGALSPHLCVTPRSKRATEVFEANPPHLGREKPHTASLLLAVKEPGGENIILLTQLPAEPVQGRVVFFMKAKDAGRGKGAAQSTPARTLNVGVLPSGCTKAVLQKMLLRLARVAVQGCLTASSKKPEALAVFEKSLSEGKRAEANPVLQSGTPVVVPIPETVVPANIDVTAVTWIKFMKDLLAQEPRAKCPVQEEADFWREQAAQIVCTKAQFQQSRVVSVIMKRLREHGSLLSTSLDALFKSLEVEAQKRIKWSSYLTPLAVYREQITERRMLLPGGHVNARLQMFADLFATIGCLAEYSDYASVGRLTALFMQFSDLISDEMTAWLSDTPSSMIIRNMDFAKEVLCNFKETFLSQRLEKKLFRTCPAKPPFVKLDCAVERIRDVHEMLSSRALFFTQLASHLPHGNSQKNISRALQLRQDIQNIPFEPQTLFHLSEAKFDAVYKSNAQNVRSFDSRLGLLLEEVVADTAVFTKACEVCAAFLALKDRRYFRTSWFRACEVTTTLFQKELSLSRKALRAFTDGTGYCKLSRGVARCAQFLCLADCLLERIDPAPLRKILSSTHLFDEAAELIELIHAIKETEIKKWSSHAAGVTSALRPGLLRRGGSPHTYHVVLCPNVVRTVQEALVLKRMCKNITIPDAVEDVLQQWDAVQRRNQRLQQVCFQFAADLQKVPAVWVTLLDVEIRHAGVVFSRGFGMETTVDELDLSGTAKFGEYLSWAGGHEVDKFIAECEDAVSCISRAVRVLHSPLETMNAAFVAFDASDNLFPFDSRIGNHTLTLGDEWAAFYEERREARFEQLREIPRDLIERSLDVLNSLRSEEGAVSALDVEWLEYSRQVIGALRKGAAKLVENGLNRFKQQLLKDEAAVIPLLSFSLSLQDGVVQFTPPKSDAVAATNAIVNDIIAYPSLLPYYSEAEDVRKVDSVASLVHSIGRLVKEELEEADSCLIFFNTQVQRWEHTLELQNKMSVQMAVPKGERLSFSASGSMEQPEQTRSEQLSKQLKNCEAIGAALTRLPSSFTLRLFLVDSEVLKNNVAQLAGNRYHSAVESTHKGIEDLLLGLETDLNMTYEGVLQASNSPAESPSDLFTALREIRESSAKEVGIADIIKPLAPLIRVLKKHHALPAPVIFSLMERVAAIPDSWARIKVRIGTLRSSVSGLQDKEVIRWLEDHELFGKRIASFVHTSARRLPNSIVFFEKDPYDMLHTARQETDALLAEENELLKIGAMLDLTQTPSKDLAGFVEVVCSLKTLWDLVSHAHSCLKESGQTFFTELCLEELKQSIGSLDEDLVTGDVIVKGQQLYGEVIESLQEWKRRLPLLETLHGSAFRRRHWKALLDECDKKCCGVHRLQCALDSGISLETPKLKLLLKQAEQEKAIESIVSSVDASWTNRSLPLRWNGSRAKTWLLDVEKADELICLAESDMIALHRIEREPASTPHIHQIHRWMGKLSTTLTVFRNWISLQSIWTEVIYCLCNHYTDGYKALYSLYVNQMAKLHCKHDTNKPYPFFEGLSLMKQFLELPKGVLTMVAEMEGKLKIRVDSCFVSVPRLGIVSDRKVKQMIAQEMDPDAVLQSFSCIAPGCATTIFSSYTELPVICHTEVRGFQSSDGSDKFMFDEPFRVSGGLESYLAGLLDAVHAKMRRHMEETWMIVNDVPRSEWCINTFTQKVALCAQMAFSMEIDAVFDQAEDGNASAFSMMHSNLTSRIRMHASVLRGVGGLQSYICSMATLVSLDVNDKKRISALLVLELHHRDVLEQISKQKATKNDFAWESQLRIAWDTELRLPVAHGPFGFTMQMGNEFVSPSGGIPFITTPETHRCRTMMLVALRLVACPAIFGPSAGGKVEMVNDLVCTLAHHMVVMVCSESLDAKLVSRIFHTTSRIGSWLVVARSCQLTIPKAVFVANHIAEILQLRRQQHTEAVVAVTMVKNTTGWKPLPAPFVSLCQPVCLMKISMSVIAVTAFASFGMKNARHLGTQLGAFYEHGAELLPDQSWSIPSLRTVLILSRARWKTTNEKSAVTGALHLVHISLLTGEDLAVGMHLLHSLFSRINAPKASPIVDTITQLNYSTGEGAEFGAVTNRLVASLALRRGLCVIGPPGCGKTVMWNIAVVALGWPKATVIFPSVLTLPDFHTQLRAAVQKKQMVVLDGAPSQWLDDLSLDFEDKRASEPLVGKSCRIVIECEHLCELSPSVATRVGIVSLKGTDVGWLGVKDRWSLSLPKEFTASVDFLCDTHLPAVFEWHRKFLATQSELNLLQTIQSTIESLLLRVKKPNHHNVDAVFSISVFWSLLAQVSTQTECVSLLSWWRRDFSLSSVIQDPTNEPRSTFLSFYHSLFSYGDPIPPAFEQNLLGLTQEQMFAAGYSALLASKQRSVCLIGGAGCGRSTVLSSLPTSGNARTVFVEGSNLTRKNEWTGLTCDRQVLVHIDDVSTLPAATKEAVRESLQINAGVTFVVVTSAKDQTFGTSRTARQFTALFLNDEESILMAICERITQQFSETENNHDMVADPQLFCLAESARVKPSASAFSEEVLVAAAMLPKASTQYVMCMDPDVHHTVMRMHRAQVLTKLQQRLSTATSTTITSRSKLISLWRYELSRIVLDTLIRPADVADLRESLDETTLSIFDYIPHALDDDNDDGDAPQGAVSPGGGVGRSVYWVPIVRGMWQTVSCEKLAISEKETVEAVSRTGKLNPSLCVPEMVRHVTSMADCLMTEARVTLLAGPRGMGKQYIALQAIKLLKLRAVLYEGGPSYQTQLPDPGAKKVKEVLVVKESRVVDQNFYEELSRLRHVKIVFICNVCSPHLKSLREQRAALFSDCQQYCMRGFSDTTKTELVVNLLKSERLTNGVKNPESTADFIVAVHRSSISHSTAEIHSIRTLLDFVRCISKVFKETTKRDHMRTRAIREGLSKSKAAIGQASVLEANLLSETSSAKMQAKATERAVEVHEKATRMYHEHSMAQELQKKRTEAASQEYQKGNREIVLENQMAKPFYEAAAAAIREIDKTAICDLRSLVKPHADIVSICIGAMVLASDGRIPKERTWAAVKKATQTPLQWLQQLVQVDPNNLLPMQVDYVTKMMNENKYQLQPAHLLVRSPACASLCAWILNIVTYHESRDRVRPKEANMADLKGSVEGFKQTLVKMQEKTKTLKAAVDSAVQDLEVAEEQYKTHTANSEHMRTRLQRAHALSRALGEDDRWSESLHKDPEWAVGDIALNAALITHAGGLPEHYRAQLLGDEWVQRLRTAGIPLLQPHLPLLRHSDSAHWATGGLPTDTFTLGSALAAAHSSRHVLMLDPQGQGLRWLTHLHPTASIASVQSNDYHEVLLKAVMKGGVVILTDVVAPLPACYDLLLDTPLVVTGSQDVSLWVAGKKAIVRDTFRIFAVSNTPAQALPSELLTKFNVINFSLSAASLKEMLLSEVTKRVVPEQEVAYITALQDVNRKTMEKLACEDSLLATLSVSDGEVLDRPELVSTLKELKHSTANINAALITAKELLQQQTCERDQYSAVVMRPMYLIQQALQLECVSPHYVFSIDWFRLTFARAVARVLKVGDGTSVLSKGVGDFASSRASYAAANTTCDVYRDLIVSIEKKDLQMFATSLCLHILNAEQPTRVPNHLLKVFLDGPVMAETGPFVETGPTWLSSDQWRCCVALEESCTEFSGLSTDLQCCPRWEEWVTVAQAEGESFPGEWQKLSLFKGLLLIKCLRPDRLQAAVALFLKAELGKTYVTPPVVSIPDVLKDPMANPCVLVWHDHEADLMLSAEAYCKRLKFCATYKLRGSEPDAAELLKRAFFHGGSVIVRNVHTVPAILHHLMNLLNTKTPHDDFLFLCSADVGKTAALPVPFLRGCRKIFSSGCSMKSVLQQSWNEATVQAPSTSRHEYKTLLFRIVFLHSAFYIRNLTYSAAFHDAPYCFGSRELATSRFVLQHWLQTCSHVPWEDLREMISSYIYGGLVSSEMDLAALKEMTEEVFSRHKLTQTDFIGISVLPSQSLENIGLSIDKVQWSRDDELQIAGVNAAVVTPIQEEPTDRHSGIRKFFFFKPDVQEEAEADLSAQQLHRLFPSEFDAIRHHAKVNAMQEFFASELTQYNALIRRINRDVLNPHHAMEQQLQSALKTGVVPEAWVAAGFETTLPLAAWAKNLHDRKEFLKQYEERRVPTVTMMHLLFRPKRFLFCVLSEKQPHDKLSYTYLRASVTNKTPDKIDIAARSGVHVWGFNTVLCRWNPERNIIDTPLPNEPLSTLPVLTLQAHEALEERELWHCAVFRTTLRKSVFMTIPLPTALPCTWTTAGAWAVLERPHSTER